MLVCCERIVPQIKIKISVIFIHQECICLPGSLVITHLVIMTCFPNSIILDGFIHLEMRLKEGYMFLLTEVGNPCPNRIM